MKKRRGVLLLELIVSITLCVIMSVSVMKMLQAHKNFNKAMSMDKMRRNELQRNIYAHEDVSLKGSRKQSMRLELKTGNFYIPVEVTEIDLPKENIIKKLYFIEGVNDDKSS